MKVFLQFTMLIFITHQAISQELNKDLSNTDLRSGRPISSKYISGRFLIYDCKAQHYACVDDASVESCREERNLALEKENRKLPCVPLKNFMSEKECVGDIYKRMALAHMHLYCSNQSAKVF